MLTFCVTAANRETQQAHTEVIYSSFHATAAAEATLSFDSLTAVVSVWVTLTTPYKFLSCHHLLMSQMPWAPPDRRPHSCLSCSVLCCGCIMSVSPCTKEMPRSRSHEENDEMTTKAPCYSCATKVRPLFFIFLSSF